MSTYITPDSGQLVINSIKDLDLNNISTDDAALYLLGGQYLEGNLYVGGTLVVNGDVITLGNAGGSLTLNANVSSDILPSTTNTYNVGSNVERWNTVFSNSVVTEKLSITTAPSEIISEVDVNVSVNHITSSTNNAVTLPDGTEGQVLTVVVTQTPAASVVITPDTPLGYSTLTLVNPGDSVTLLSTDGKWAVLSNFRASVS